MWSLATFTTLTVEETDTKTYFRLVKIKWDNAKHSLSLTRKTPFFCFSFSDISFTFFFFQPKIGLCIKPGIQERGMECGEPGEWEEYYISENVLKHSGKSPQKIRKNVLKHSGKCRQTFWEISPNIPGNVLKHSRECCWTFRGMLLNILGDVAKHSGESPETFRGMSSNIPGMSPIFGVNEENY